MIPHWVDMAILASYPAASYEWYAHLMFASLGISSSVCRHGNVSSKASMILHWCWW